MQISFTIRFGIETPPERLFDFTNAAENFVSFTGFGPIPGIRSATYETPGPPALGSRRRILKTDGSEHLEEIVAFDRPVRHAARISGLTPPLSWLVREGIDDWRFRPEGTGTLIDRTFAFELRSPLVAPIAILIMHLWMRAAVRRDLRNIARELGGQ